MRLESVLAPTQHGVQTTQMRKLMTSKPKAQINSGMTLDRAANGSGRARISNTETILRGHTRVRSGDNISNRS